MQGTSSNNTVTFRNSPQGHGRNNQGLYSKEAYGSGTYRNDLGLIKEEQHETFASYKIGNKSSKAASPHFKNESARGYLKPVKMKTIGTERKTNKVKIKGTNSER